MYLAVGLLFGPAGSGDEEHLGVGADGLLILLWRADPRDGGAWRGEVDFDFFRGGRAGLRGEGRESPAVEEQEPWALSRVRTASMR